MATTELLSAIKHRKNIENFSGIARLMGITRQSLHRYRSRHTFLDDKQALKAAELLRIDAGAVLAAIHAERAICPETKAVWEDLSRSSDGGKTLGIIETWKGKDVVFRKQLAA